MNEAADVRCLMKSSVSSHITAITKSKNHLIKLYRVYGALPNCLLCLCAHNYIQKLDKKIKKYINNFMSNESNKPF